MNHQLNPHTDPDFGVPSELVNYVLAKFPLRHETGTKHGHSHWRRVYRYTQLIAGQETRLKIQEEWTRYFGLFALFHDSQRTTDGVCYQHGRAAAGFLMRLYSELPLFKEEYNAHFKVAVMACRYHTCMEPDTAEHDELRNNLAEQELAFVECCLDADRLDITRVGFDIDPAYLFTEQAKHIAQSFVTTGPQSWKQ